MSTKMPKTIKEERLRWVLPIINKEVGLVDVVKVCPHSQRSLERWLAEYRKGGEAGLVSEIIPLFLLQQIKRMILK